MFNGTILVSENGKIIHKNAYGYANLSSKKQLKTNSSFYLASVSKQFTTMAIMILKKQNKLSYDDTLSKFFPEFPDFANQVTIKHLMTHTSGMPDYYNFGIVKPGITNYDVLEALVNIDSLEFQSGTKYSYSNGGYVLLSLIAEKVSKQSFSEFMKENIFDPLNMNNSLVYDELKPEIKNRVIGYNQFNEIDDYDLFTSGGGGIYSTVEDLYKWDQALYTDILVDSATMQEAFTPYKFNNDSLTSYGYGWVIDDNIGTYYHTGGLAGYRTIIERQINTKNAIICLTNNGDAINWEIILQIRNILEGSPYEFPKKQIWQVLFKTIEEHNIDTAIGKYYSLKENHYNEYYFDEDQLNTLGNYYLINGKTEIAIALFKLNVELYPDKFNVYDSLAEAYMLNGDIEPAIQNYQKSLELNSDNQNAIDKLEELQNK